METKGKKPRFFRNFRILSLTIKDVLCYPGKYIGGNHSSITEVLKLRRKLLLYKIVKFNRKYFSAPSTPAYPSKAYDNMVLKGGLNFNSMGTPLKNQIDMVFLGVSNSCPLKCSYCYERHNLNNGSFIPSAVWNQVIAALQKRGVNVFILSGGEPLLEIDKIINILNSADKDLSDFHIHTSGRSVSEEKVVLLKKAGLTAAAIGLDDFDGTRHDSIRGKGSFADAVKALKLFNKHGIMTYVNFCASPDIIKDDNLLRYYDFVKGLNVSIIQLLEPRNCGGFLEKGPGVLLRDDDRKKLLEFTLNGNLKRRFRNYPLIYYVAHVDGKEQLGCTMGGLSHFYIDSAGNVCPCVFFPVRYGNILEEEIEEILVRMRKSIPLPLHTECPSLLLSEKIRDVSESRADMPVSFELVDKEIELLYGRTSGPQKKYQTERMQNEK